MSVNPKDNNLYFALEHCAVLPPHMMPRANTPDRKPIRGFCIKRRDNMTDKDRVDILSDILLAVIDIIVGIRLPDQWGK